MKTTAILPAALAATLAAALSLSAHAAPLTFSDRTAFEAALPGGISILTDDFETDSANAAVQVFDSGVVSTASPFLLSDDGPSRHVIRLGLFVSQVDVEADFDAPTSVVWTFPTEIFAFGFDVGDANNEDFAGVNITINDVDGASTFLLFDVAGGSKPNVTVNGFAGFISAGPISSIEFTGSDFVNGLDQFALDNAVYVSQVPVPAALPLLAAALAGLAFIGRRARHRHS